MAIRFRDGHDSRPEQRRQPEDRQVSVFPSQTLERTDLSVIMKDHLTAGQHAIREYREVMQRRAKVKVHDVRAETSDDADQTEGAPRRRPVLLQRVRLRPGGLQPVPDRRRADPWEDEAQPPPPVACAIRKPDKEVLETTVFLDSRIDDFQQP